VINQPFATIERYFGPHLTETTYPQGEEVWTERTYANAGLRRALPTLPAKAEFKIIFVDGRAQWILLNSAPGQSMPDPSDREWQAFTYDQTAAFNFFEYVFGYRPTTYTPVPGFYGGGHEGFFEHAICLGDGIQTTYTEYIMGIGDIRLSYNPACDPSLKPPTP
jgi:hypothetical protein